MSNFTKLLSAIERGEQEAADKLLPLVYQELRKLAAAKLSKEKPGPTLVHWSMTIDKGGHDLAEAKWAARTEPHSPYPHSPECGLPRKLYVELLPRSGERGYDVILLPRSGERGYCVILQLRRQRYLATALTTIFLQRYSERGAHDERRC